ncbi:uncharacterized protein SCODWIG_00264 [Saccharomycodes ludwigii]|uniref:phosphatidylinositol-3,4,5-trisphosphate 3-phosphatase n=1 Tax=Saccharomycodes ludwigii TaxID=36035 RepID=A0A376B1G4_9ASCO|nr:hypothetical protein SCDLUD_002875 [Saccharomycodes ludwigii]KAH3901383.1 hypothetical protein SCDLUD_002875 [Saccharomycodes ludwigii]SSD58503.1 uncharacterized protein SCODWIG_00264 [Saccharomycodes ludwigii]
MESSILRNSEKLIKTIYSSPLNTMNTECDHTIQSDIQTSTIVLRLELNDNPYNADISKFRSTENFFTKDSSSKEIKKISSIKNLKLPLDISYISDRLIVGSYPVTKYPKLLYRNKLEDVIQFLNQAHGHNRWKIFNLKVEQSDSDYTDNELLSIINSFKDANKQVALTNYENNESITLPLTSNSTNTDTTNQNSPRLGWFEMASEKLKKTMSYSNTGSYNRSYEKPQNLRYNKNNAASNISQYLNRCGWMDHAPPTFLNLQKIIDNMKQWLDDCGENICFVHCKMGKGRSGVIATAYMMKYDNLCLKDALEIFKNTRFKPGVSRGITIPSQLRYLSYHEQYLSFKKESDRLDIIKILNSESSILLQFQIRQIRILKPSNLLFDKKLREELIFEINFECVNSHNMNKIEPLFKYVFNFSDYLLNLNGNIVMETATNGNKLLIFKENKCLKVGISDVRITFSLKTKSKHTILNNVSKYSSYSYFWLNFYWETLSCSVKTHEPQYYLLGSLQKEQANKVRGFSMGQYQINWNTLDGSGGINGNLHKGLKLFDKIEIDWAV